MIFRTQAAEAWEELYRRKPPWRPAHLAALDDAEKVCGSPEAAMQSWNVYLTIESPYFEGHSPLLFAKHIERFCRIPALRPLRPQYRAPQGERPFRAREPGECLTAWNARRLGNEILTKHHGTIDGKGFCEHCRVFVWQTEPGPCAACEADQVAAAVS